MRIRLAFLVVVGLLLCFVPTVLAQTGSSGAIKRTADGHPDFSGTWGGQKLVTGDKVAVTDADRESASPQGLKKSVFQGGDAPRVPTRSQLAKQLPLTPK